MPAITVAHTFAATVADAERCWYDTARWARWVDGLETVSDVDGPWPEAGARVRWRSGPAGRGEVIERVLAREPLRGQTVAVSDPSLEGEQSVRFDPDGDGVQVAVTLQYRLRGRSPLMLIVEPLFIRRAMRASLEATVARFGTELGAPRSRRRNAVAPPAP